MSSAASQSLINLLLESGVQSREEAAELALNLNGGSWVGQMLDSGKVDEQRFLGAIGNFFRVPVVSIDAKKIDRTTLSILPSRFVFQHQILPIEAKENSVVLATYDLFNSVGRQLASQLLKKPAEWVLVPRAQLLRAIKTLYGIGAETFDEILKTNRAFEVLQDAQTSTDLNADDPEASVVKFVNQTIAVRHHLTSQSDGAHGHRGAAFAAGWPHEFAREQSRDRRSRFDYSNGKRRIDQLTVAQSRRTTIQLRSSRSEQETGRHHSQSARSRQRNHFAHRPDRLRKIDIVILLLEQH